MTNPIKNSLNILLEKINKFNESGCTALGPALLASVSLLSDSS